MDYNKIRKQMLAGKQVLGTFLEINDSQVVEALAISGLDFFIVDMEHSSISDEALKGIIQTADYREITPLVRVKNTSRGDIMRPLDLGAQGLIIPDVRSVEEVQQIISWGKYQPIGNRGFFTSRATDFGKHPKAQDIDELFTWKNEETLIIPQCETQEALDSIEEIVALEGVDGIFVGPFDLSIAMGLPTLFDHPDFIVAIDRILKASQAAGKFAFIFGMDAKAGKTYIDQGFNAVTCGMDMSWLQSAVQNVVQELKSSEQSFCLS